MHQVIILLFAEFSCPLTVGFLLALFYSHATSCSEYFLLLDYFFKKKTALPNDYSSRFYCHPLRFFQNLFFIKDKHSCISTRQRFSFFWKRLEKKLCMGWISCCGAASAPFVSWPRAQRCRSIQPLFLCCCCCTAGHLHSRLEGSAAWVALGLENVFYLR